MTFDQLYEKHYAPIYRFCYRFTGDRDTAGDITQETFMKLYLRIKNSKDPIQNTRAWLYRVAGNLCLNAENTLKRREEIVSNIPVADRETHDPESILLKKEQKELLHRSLNQLRPEQRMLVLMYGEGLSYAEMSEATGIPLNSLGKTLWRCIEKIANNIKTIDHGPGNTVS